MSEEKRRVRAQRVKKMNAKLVLLFPVSKIELNYKTPWQLMVAVQLSAQCTDKRVNLVTANLFKKYKKLEDYVSADFEVFAQDIKPCGFYRAKARNILGAARMLKADFGGKIPKTIPELLLLPGVARKTANVVLANLYGVTDGIAVDTHIRRFAIRFDLSDFKDPVRIERDLMEIVPKSLWWDFHHRLVLYGRYVCPARPHDCSAHPLTKFYPPAAQIWPKTQGNG